MERVIAQLSLLQSCNDTWMLNERQLIALDSYAIDNRTKWTCLCTLHAECYFIQNTIESNKYLVKSYTMNELYLDFKIKFRLSIKKKFNRCWRIYIYFFLLFAHTDFSTFLTELIKCPVKLFNSLLTLNGTMHSNLL